MIEDFQEDCTILIQGPIDSNMFVTYDMYKKNKIVFSTWKSDSVLEKTLLSLESDRVKIVIDELPDTENVVNTSNRYYQIISCLNGLKLVDTKYVIKVRTDEYFNNLSLLYDLCKKDPSKLITSTIFFRKTFSVPYHVSDHVICSKTKDLLNLYSTCKDFSGKDVVAPPCPESFMFCIWLYTKGLQPTPDRSLVREYTKLFCDIVPVEKLEPFCVKYNSEKKTFINDRSFQNESYDVISSLDEL